MMNIMRFCSTSVLSLATRTMMFELWTWMNCRCWRRTPCHDEIRANLSGWWNMISFQCQFPSSHNHGSKQCFFFPVVVTFQMQPISTSIIMGERVYCGTFQGTITHYGNSYEPTAIAAVPRPSCQNHPGALGTACGSINGGTCKSESLGKNTANALFSWLVHGPCDEQIRIWDDYFQLCDIQFVIKSQIGMLYKEGMVLIFFCGRQWAPFWVRSWGHSVVALLRRQMYGC